jgi:putative ABC transport system substrate-binding protein
VKRREFITMLGGAATAWPLAARAQQPTVPVIGWLAAESREAQDFRVVAFRQSLKEAGYIEGQNLTIEYRWAEGQHDHLPALAADLVRRQVTVIATPGNAAALAAKTATSTIPILFQLASDPVQLGLVASLNRPGGNVTGVTSLNLEVGPKKLEHMHELVPNAVVIGMLVNPNNPDAEIQSRDAQAAARKLGVELHTVPARTERDFDAVFATLVKLRAGALVVGPRYILHYAKQTARRADSPPRGARDRPVSRVCRGRRSDELWNQHHGPVSPARRLYQPHPQGREARRSAGPAAVKLELVINLKTAKALRLTVPAKLLAIADEVIE